ncbi:ATP-dependent DNA helicase [Micractinium conductrix]|uniref:ATP-dependent DNA helicase n=1 Tax=Micractinium conductrix TaxID=554055 RepID=A0A2P6VKI2_9CHLO|nr:ATP-dependent DNA helicase [Micractinium conductrix]|eukprot:PSC74584.1 ATP-dependent DNA helicase [Micractinium conductrix]
MMRYSWCTTALLSYDSDTVEQRLSGLQQLFGLSDGDLVALFRCLVELLGLKPEEVVRPRRDKLEALLGPFDKQMLRRFIQTLQHPVAGCTLEEARQVLLSTPQLSVFALDTPKFRRRMEALTDFYEHANTAEMLLSRNRGTHLMSSLWTVGPRMAFVRHLRLERGQPDLRTSQVACTLGPFCRSVRADVATYKGFEAAWLASPEAAQLCEHERPRRQATGAGALGSSGSGGGVCSSSSSSSSDDDDSSSSEKDERG